jgi:CMP-N-acetylneuraminate monooxygenase
MTLGTTRLRLGLLDGFTKLPATIAEGARTFLLVRDDIGFHLLSTVCPHQGGAVFDNGSCFECPLHGWRFDRMTGRSLNAPSRALASIPVTVEDGVLFAELPRQAPLDRVRQSAAVSKPGLSLHLHAHACLEISYDGFTLLTDPWLDGPAFLGAWAQYPPADASGAELRPDAILITHEHSDHFHEPTLRQFDRGTPVYVPDFPNRRLPRRLAALGFTNVTAMRFGDGYVVHEGWNVTCFEPESYWNDAFALVDIEGFRIFDINDAGVNHRIARMVAPVDVLAVQFSAGASGYPWTWAHLTDDQKVAISQRACAGKLNLIREATQLYRAGAVLPFASHFILWHESHRAYARLMKRNTLGDVRKTLADLEVALIDLLPGETWDVGQAVMRRRSDDRDAWFQPQTATDYMQRAVDDATFATSHPVDESLSREELVAYLEQLNSISEIVHCEDLTVRIRAASAEVRRSLDVSFAIAAGHLTVLTSAPDVPNLSIDIPLNVLTAVIRNELSWDEAFIGYWCRFDRHPDVYHAGFWRLFQAPYLKRRSPVPVGAPVRIGAASTVAELLESHGPDADRILRRYGLYCSGCQHSIAESIEMAARQHGVNPARVDQLVRELNSAFGSDASSRR